MRSKIFAVIAARTATVLAVGVAGIVVAQQPSTRSPEFERQIVDTVNNINEAFTRGDMRELNSYMHDDVTMLHGHARMNNLREVEAQWRNLFAIRAKAAMTYTLKTRDVKTQVYGDVVVVTFGYEHPKLIGAKVATESGHAVYVLLRQPAGAAVAGKRPIVMVHCSVIADRHDDAQLP